MTVLVLGATGATGFRVVNELLGRGNSVVVIVRSKERLLTKVNESNNLSIVEGTVLDIEIELLKSLLLDCDAVISCLGHNLTFKGLYGRPIKLVRDSIRRVCRTIDTLDSGKRIKMVLMNTTGNRNRDVKEPRSFGENLVISLIRLLLPPQSDNEKAAEYFRVQVGRAHKQIGWVVVRPDSLIDSEMVSRYEIFLSPIRSPIFNAGQTSRINVAHFMCELLTHQTVWDKWEYNMPVIYNI